jgi:8-oxo-dGTP diphosphatase
VSSCSRSVPEGKPYPGYWEFPGGKIEAGEDPHAALARELKEELGIEVTAATPWITRVYAYTHATVRLHFLRVSAWRGEPQPLEDQAIRWQRVGAPDVSPMLPANAPVLASLDLPAVMVISDAARRGIDGWIAALAERALTERMLVQIREKGMDRLKAQHLLSRALVRAQPFGSRVVVNSDNGTFPQCDGVHLTAGALLAAGARPAGRLVGASCHDEAELAPRRRPRARLRGRGGRSTRRRRTRRPSPSAGIAWQCWCATPRCPRTRSAGSRARTSARRGAVGRTAWRCWERRSTR